RPMAPVIDGLIQAGVHITAEQQDPVEHLPLTVHGNGAPTGGTVSIDAGGSSHFISALLLVAATFTNGLDIRHTGEQNPSPEHEDMTIKAIEQVGGHAHNPQPNRWLVSTGHITDTNTVVQPYQSYTGPYFS